ncbi:MAG: STAS domain-containing protein [Candidatus Omnitrophica bacterium]|nr:STAS domain-containing protein [Candidatus Omnitrophota bacterium]
MHIKTEDKNDVKICYINGEVDINTAPQIKKIFDKVIAEKKPKIVVNFKDVSYIDSSGLATLVEMLKNIRTYGGKLKLANLSSKIKSLFEITKLDKLFDISADEN